MYRTPWRSLLAFSILLVFAGIGMTVWGLAASAPAETLVLFVMTALIGALVTRMSLFGIRHGRPPSTTGWVALGVVTFSLVWMIATR